MAPWIGSCQKLEGSRLAHLRSCSYKPSMDRHLVTSSQMVPEKSLKLTESIISKKR